MDNYGICAGSGRMTKKDGSLIIFKGIALSQCRQCGEQYIPGKWAEKIGELMRKEDTLVPLRSHVT
jgi:YgiT-type zinc finger domain-containing protein